MSLARIKARLDRDEGAILVLAAFLLIVLIGMAALAVDITLQSSDRQHLWNSADAAALAGAALLPDGIAAESQAVDIALANDGELAGNIGTTFRCLVAANSAGTGPADDEVPDVCEPTSGIAQGIPTAIPPVPAGWTCANGICTAVCIPADGDTCNTIVLATQKTTDYAFAPAIGVDTANTNIISAACRGSCGAGLTGPVDLIVVIDRSGSMTNAGEVAAEIAAGNLPPGSPNDMDQVEEATLAVLDYFDPAIQHVGLAVLPPAQLGNDCVSGGESEWSSGRWLVVGLSSDYKDTLNYDFNGDGTNDLDSTSELVNVIRCSTDDGYTDLGSPIRDSANVTAPGTDDAFSELLNNGRSGVKQGIIFLSDGGANRPDPANNPCLYASAQALAAKNQGIELFTIGFGVDNPGASGRIVFCDQDTSGPYVGAPVTNLLANMATQPSGNNCTAATTDFENSDDDHFFCLPKDEDLSKVFLAIATQFAQGSRLVQLPPGG